MVVKYCLIIWPRVGMVRMNGQLFGTSQARQKPAKTFRYDMVPHTFIKILDRAQFWDWLADWSESCTLPTLDVIGECDMT